jgi:UDPglucose 6-dehydrogenase
MKIGFLGLGKLGLTCALAIETKGHEIAGYDVDSNVRDIISSRKIPYREEGAQEALNNSNIKLMEIKELVKWSEIIFVAIQTPHDSQYEGITRLPKERKDFDYTYLRDGMADLCSQINDIQENRIVIIISTVLPGTLRREIYPLLGVHVKLCYNPFFIAMGTTMRDFLNPEFVLFGVDKKWDTWATYTVSEFYKTIHDKPFVKISIESAELAKVAYNTYISSKITIANTLMEICHKIPLADVDEVNNVLKMATDRLISTKYMDAGMGDGGGCHPRDNIALSWLARKLNLSYDFYESIMISRENQTDWLSDIVINEHEGTGLPIVILGKTFKPETNLTVGSPSILLANIIMEKGYSVTMWDPHTDDYTARFTDPCLFFIGTKHSDFLELMYPKGSIIIDPFRYVPDVENVRTIRIGEKRDE